MNIHIARFRRAEIERRIEELIDLLDILDGEPDLEPSLGWPEAHGLSQVRHIQLHDEREEENEHGGDILDEPHDGGDDDEPFLGWSNPRFPDDPVVTPAGWTYDGERVAEHMLRRLGDSLQGGGYDGTGRD